MVIFRLVLLCILVGVVLKVLGLDPLNILRSVEDLIRYVWNMGFDAVRLAVALFPARRGDRDPDLADRAAHARAEGAVARLSSFCCFLLDSVCVRDLMCAYWPSTEPADAGS